MPQHTNRLSRETSPYLLQHQHNPVDWYPWGDEAFAAAREQNKPIFLSVGYSTCYWCHVMERQCFENEAIAAEMNRLFINIKVDREERPDVDQLYMTAVQVLTRQGGWPMSVFLLHDLRPFYGGTYFPPADAHGRPGFPTLIRALEDAYRNRRGDVEKTANQLADILKQLAKPTAPSEPITIDGTFLERLIDRSTSDYDPEFGGFGRAPKFPRQTLLELILASLSHRPDARREQMLRHTLDALANGGIRDHLGGGFHRYSTDAHWLVPHFEIMLYDNALLAWVYAEAHRQFGEERYARVARGICDFVLRDMTDPAGGFYTAFDAEVDAHEGLTYLWTADEIEEILGSADARVFNAIYGLSDGPNFADPHHGNGAPDKNILFLPDGPARENDPAVIAMREKLLAARKQRKQPLLDTKIITSWNALMIRALAEAGDVLREPRYLTAASAAADFLLTHHRDDNGGLRRTSRNGDVKYAGFLDDYAFLAQALLSLAQSTAQPERRTQAQSIVQQMLTRFGDSELGGLYFTDKDSADLIVRQQVATDSPLPSGTAVAAAALLDLDDWQTAQPVVLAFAEQLKSNGEGMSSLVQVALDLVHQRGPFSTTASASAQPTESDDVVTLSTHWSDAKTLQLTLHIRDGYHIGSSASAPHMVNTQLSIDGLAADIHYPTAQKVVFPFAEDELSVYLGTIEIKAIFPRPPASAVHATLRYQACTDRACLAVVSRAIDLAPPA